MKVGDLCALCASAFADPALSFYVAYHFVAELLLFPIASDIPLTVGIFSSEEISRLYLLHR